MIPNEKPKPCHNLQYKLEQGHWPIIRKKLVQLDKPAIVIDSYLENDKLNDTLKKTLPRNTSSSDIFSLTKEKSEDYWCKVLVTNNSFLSRTLLCRIKKLSRSNCKITKI